MFAPVPDGSSRWDAFEVGDAAWTSRTFTRADFDHFARLSGDRNVMHHDDEIVGSSRFTEPIVPLAMIVGAYSALVGMALPGAGAVIVDQSFRALHPVPYGEPLTLSARVADKSEAAGAFSLSLVAFTGTTVVLDGAMTVQVEDVDGGEAPPSEFGFATRRGSAVVTGGGGAIGSAVALDLAGRGWDLVLVGRDRTRLAATAAGCEERGSRIEVVEADLADPSSRQLAVKALQNHAAGALVHAASPAVTAPAGELFEVNYVALRELSDALLPSMLRVQHGRIVGVGSMALRTHPPGWTDYEAAKAAAGHYLAGLAWRFGRYGIAPLSIHPGFVSGPYSDHLRPDGVLPLEPEEVAEIVANEITAEKAWHGDVWVEPGHVLRQSRAGGWRDEPSPAPDAARGPHGASARTNDAASSGEGVVQRVRDTVRRTLGLPASEDLADGGMGVTAGWDSLAQVSIVLALESEFGIRLTSDEISRAGRIAEMEVLVAERLARAG